MGHASPSILTASLPGDGERPPDVTPESLIIPAATSHSNCYCQNYGHLPHLLRVLAAFKAGDVFPPSTFHFTGISSSFFSVP